MDKGKKQVFYHANDWGFDTSTPISRKIHSEFFLTSIGLPCCIKRASNSSEIQSLFNHGSSYFLVYVIDKETHNFYVFQNISSYVQLLSLIKCDLKNKIIEDNLYYCLIERMHECPGCFTANVISNGRGNAIIEFIKGTVDNRYLSNGGNYIKAPQKIIFNDYKMVYCDDYYVFRQMWESIKICLFFKGYFECSYTSINKIKNVYYSFYSSKEIFQDISLEYWGDDMLKYRCAFLSLI